MECVGVGLALPLSEEDAVKSCIHIYAGSPPSTTTTTTVLIQQLHPLNIPLLLLL